ncbi:oligopeptide transport system substrate-binding protein [Oribacterium sp. KHPX15]|uniref:peptide ABC transporter substrate-binding protein n=1 Tax=unclassified Oribacterium TaxID=2629782 RepID=UPI0004E2849A|nr:MULTISPECIES: peptide ABC transporter substrate-binding protein [unclassified Oribacterium]SDZ89308.1 oligopeptide transport system substrate-binding protein [Oribacterium sp. KHPX15]
MKKNLTAIVAAAVSAALLLSACGGSSTTPESVAPGNASESSDAEKVLNVQRGPSPETIDPALNSASDGANMILHAFEGLLKFDQNNDIVGGLAESWEQSEDGLTWTFHLRPDLKWSDGSALTANDFVYSWKRVADPNTAAPYGYDLLNVVAGYEEASKGDIDALQVEATDDNTFVVHLSNPCVYFDKIAAFTVMVPVQQATIEAAGDSWATDPATYITDGPYYMTEFTDGSQIVFEKNPYYWDAENITFDKIVWHLIEDSNTSYTAYNQGELDMIKDVPTEEIPTLNGNEEFHVEPLMGTYYVTFNTQKEPFNDAKVREALSLAIDRKYVADTIMQGTYSPATNFVGAGVSDAAEGSSFVDVTKEKYGDHFDIENYDANLEKAKELLAEAGYPNGEGFPAFDYLTNDSGYHKAVAEYLQSAWAELGLTMNVNIQEWKTVTADRRAGNFDVARNGWVYDWDDPSNMINLLETTNGNNDGKYSSAEFDKLVDEARSTTDIDKHYDLLHQAEQVLLNDAAMAPIAYYNEFWLQKPNLKGTWHSPYGYWYFMYGSFE